MASPKTDLDFLKLSRLELMVEIDSLFSLMGFCFQVVYRGVLHLNVFCLKTIMFVLEIEHMN